MAPLEANDELRPGSQLGRYQLLVPVGAGGMAKVWAARAVGPRPMQRLVAIKTALGEAMANPEFERLFMDEARIASLIQHPNVCGIQGLDEEDGVTYLVLDWSDGATLRELLDGLPGQKADFFVAARIVADVCAGLHAAHELEGEDGATLHVVHRDVSPQNVLIASTGHVRIADFGVAKARGQLHRPTETGEMKGKLSYMAPEQVTTKNLDRRVDIFALGCVLYEATLGTRPFHGEDALSTLYQLLEQDLVAPSSIDPTYPEALESIVVRALAKNPDERFATAEQMQQALHGWLASERRVITERGVAEVLHQSVGRKIAARHNAIQTAITSLDNNRPVPEHADPHSESITAEPSIQTLDNAAVARDGRRSPLWWVAVTASAVAILAGSWVAWAPSRAQPIRTEAPPAAPAMPTAHAASTTRSESAQKRERVVITIRAEPPSAVLKIDDGPPLANPYVASVPPDTQEHVIEAIAAGFESRREIVRFDRTQELGLALKKARPLRPTPTARVRPQPLRTATTLPKPPSTSSPRPDATTKPPRQLDQENPF